jgi:hypothetical protein
MANNSGEAGQPYLIPLVVLKGALGPEGPMTTTSLSFVARHMN